MWPDEWAETRAIRREAQGLRAVYAELLAGLTAAERCAVAECVAELGFRAPSELSPSRARQWLQWEAQLVRREVSTV